jgi:hypothetical protein
MDLITDQAGARRFDATLICESVAGQVSFQQERNFVVAFLFDSGLPV